MLKDALIIKAVKGLIRSRIGDERRHRVRARAGVADEPFIASQPCDDSVTDERVAAAGGHTDVPIDGPCEACGRLRNSACTHEVVDGPLRHGVGRRLPELLEHLTHLHARAGISCSPLNPPGFAVAGETPDGLNPRDCSDRAGIAPRLTGLPEGVGVHGSLVVDMTRSRLRTPGAPDGFHVNRTPFLQAPAS